MAFPSLREKCLNTEFFLVRIFLFFSPNKGNYGPEKTPYLDTFHAVLTFLPVTIFPQKIQFESGNF